MTLRTACLLDPSKGLCRDASTHRISPRAGHQLHGCLVTTVAGLPPASRIQLPRTHPRVATSHSGFLPTQPHDEQLPSACGWCHQPPQGTRTPELLVMSGVPEIAVARRRYCSFHGSGERVRAGFLPRVLASKRASGQGWITRTAGSHRALRRSIRSQFTRVRWLRRRSACRQCRGDLVAKDSDCLGVSGHGGVLRV